MTMIAQRLMAVREQIAQACVRASRDTDRVQLLAVSKTFGADAVQAAFDAGQRAFGENYIQEAVEKIGLLAHLRAQGLQWHCIGPIQSNKSRLVAEHFDWAHTVDRLKIAERLSAQRPPGMPALQVCIQVNVDDGANKSGVAPAEAAALVRAVAALKGLCVRGLMSLPEPSRDYAGQLDVHRRTRNLFDQIGAQRWPELSQWDTVSMGMSQDLDAAVAAGSTMVRVGTAVFGQRLVNP